MPADDVSAILASLPEAQQEELLKLIKGKASKNLEQLLQYEGKTADYIMTPNFFAASEETTAAAAVEPIREMVDVQMVFYVYVVDEGNRLKGVISQTVSRNKIRHPTERSNDNTGIHSLYPHTLRRRSRRSLHDIICWQCLCSMIRRDLSASLRLMT